MVVVKTVSLAETMDQSLTRMDMDLDPPFQETYKFLLNKSMLEKSRPEIDDMMSITTNVGACDLPLIDLSQLNLGEMEREKCKMEIAEASKEWGFFQVVNHGISREILEQMRKEQIKVFKQPFEKKSKEDKYFNFSRGSYRWGTPSATCLRQLSWSEAFHVPLTDVINLGDKCNTPLSSIMGQFATTVSDLAQKLADILAEKMADKSTFFSENCLPSTCYLRMNRYPPCHYDVFGLMPHTDSDFLTVLHQDQVGGLQLVKDGKWIAVKPNPDALIVNIGDLFQAWSNGIYKSVEHRVLCNPKVERFSIAYFLCPSYDTVIKSCQQPSIYRTFSFREYRQQIQEDVQNLGFKIGLPRFLL